MKDLKIMAISAASLLLVSPVFAAQQDNVIALNKVSYQVQAEQWATTKTAKVIVGINATLNNTQLGTIHSQILANLKKIADSDWHITQFNRSKNNSGLEQLSITAEARISDTALANIRKNAESVSKPGANYSIAAIQFTPSLAEMEKVRFELRDRIFQRAKAELASLNKTYPNANYTLHNINFFSSSMPEMPQPTIFTADIKRMAPEQLVVSDKIKVRADIVLASK